MMHCSAASTAPVALSRPQLCTMSATKLCLHEDCLSFRLCPYWSLQTAHTQQSWIQTQLTLQARSALHTWDAEAKDLKQGAHGAWAYLSASCWRASGKDAMPAKVRRQWVDMTVAGSVGAASLGSTSRQRCSRRPRASTPPERVSSPPFSSEETHVSQHSSTAACTVMVKECQSFRSYQLHKVRQDILAVLFRKGAAEDRNLYSWSLLLLSFSAIQLAHPA